jgi:effector-binding domain-containing protein
MSQEYDENPINQNTAAERDDLFITQHPLDGRTVQLGAAFTGATEAVIKAIDETKELLDKTIEPGDMNPAHIPHPVDDAIKMVADITEPRDMRIENSPHPKDKITAAIHSKFEEIKQAGVIEERELALL